MQWHIGAYLRYAAGRAHCFAAGFLTAGTYLRNAQTTFRALLLSIFNAWVLLHNAGLILGDPGPFPVFTVGQ